MILKHVSTALELLPYLQTKLYKGFSKKSLVQQTVNDHLVLLKDDLPVARCSLWWQRTPKYQDYQLGLIGHYAASSDEAAHVLLEHALIKLVDQNCSLAVGPMDGSTWRSYRFVTQGDAPPFLLEPSNPANYPQQWQAAGFKPLAEYFSALQTMLPNNPKLSGKLESLKQNGISIRPLNIQRLDAELNAIYDLTLKSFTHNFLYTPIDKGEFLEQYQQVLPYIQPELVLIAEHNENIIAYLFALPDFTQKQRGEALDTFIIKTLATHPDYTGQGIGTSLTALAIKNAKQLGFTQAIHALMISDNHSRKISSHYQQEELRRYVLFAKDLSRQ